MFGTYCWRESLQNAIFVSEQVGVLFLELCFLWNAVYLQITLAPLFHYNGPHEYNPLSRWTNCYFWHIHTVCLDFRKPSIWSSKAFSCSIISEDSELKIHNNSFIIHSSSWNKKLEKQYFGGRGTGPRGGGRITFHITPPLFLSFLQKGIIKIHISLR